MQNTHNINNNARGVSRIFSHLSLAVAVVLSLSTCAVLDLSTVPERGKVTSVSLTKSGLIPGNKATFSFNLSSALASTETLTITNIDKVSGAYSRYPEPDLGTYYAYVSGASAQVTKIAGAAGLINKGPYSKQFLYTATAGAQRVTLTAKDAGVKTQPELQGYSAVNYAFTTNTPGTGDTNSGTKGIYAINIASNPLTAGHEYTDANMLSPRTYPYNPSQSTAAQQAAAIAALVNTDSNSDGKSDSGYTAVVSGSSVITFTANETGSQIITFPPEYNMPPYDLTPRPQNKANAAGKTNSPVFTQGTPNVRIRDEYQLTFKEVLQDEKLLLTNMVIGDGTVESTILEYIPSEDETTTAEQASAFVDLVNSKSNCFFTASVPAKGTKVTLTLKASYATNTTTEGPLTKKPVRTIKKL
ncbi:MAG: hypothetical protein Ta2A_17120 [Treponemataceae bacterium]|nr:MAG: hypothetical protein Ta2A_17120 [Treponemataceae bacterium]